MPGVSQNGFQAGLGKRRPWGLALVIGGAVAGAASAFSPSGIALRTGSSVSSSVCSRSQVGSGVSIGKGVLLPSSSSRRPLLRPLRRVIAAATAPKMALGLEDDQDVEEMAFAEIPMGFDAKSKSMDEWFEMLGADNNFDRTLAGFAISKRHMEDEQGVIDRLFGMLTLKEVLHRRAAVQSLGMIGWKVLPRTQNLMLTTEDMTTRASCSKVMGAVALRNPETLPNFPMDALMTMRKAMVEIPDPVTKIASMSALAQIAGGDMANGYPGNKKALELIFELGGLSEDVALLMSVTNALASIARSNPQWKELIMDEMEKMQKAKGSIEGFEMVGGILRTQLMTLSAGKRGRDFPEPANAGLGGGFSDNWSFGNDDDDDDDDDWDSVAADMKKK